MRNILIGPGLLAMILTPFVAGLAGCAQCDQALEDNTQAATHGEFLSLFG